MKKVLFLLATVSAILFISCNQPTSGDSVNKENKAISEPVEFRDFGAEPFVFNIEDYTVQNETYRTSIWTGTYMQMTVMTLQPGEDIGLELHTTTDQFLRVEEGNGIVMMGDSEDNLDFQKRVSDDIAIFIPAGKWHNLKNDSDKPLKLYSIYAPVEHPHSTIHATREEGLEGHAH